ncbi:MAG: pyruvate dehydrogenase (acetyl-transferring), homodimeric type [Acidobacteriota bacterium]
MDDRRQEGSQLSPADQEELHEWMESLDFVLQKGGPERVRNLLRQLHNRAQEAGVRIPFSATTPYLNTIPLSRQPVFPGNRAIERRIKSLIRWNAMAMVVRANREAHGIGGHISTFASAATLLEIGFNHFFHGPQHPDGCDQVFLQGHASPGIYARAFLEGRISEKQLENFRRELAPGGGLSSYPHPWLMPDLWQFPTVSMGLSPLMAIYQARFNRYLEDRHLKEKTGRVWSFLGDGELDEPEALGAIGLAGRARLDNLIFVVNCNLQRLDGPVRGNFKIIQELEGAFRGAGWYVIKVIWGNSWDPLLEKDTQGLLARRMEEVVDGDYQKYVVTSGAYIREHFFGTDPRLLKMVEHLSDDNLAKLRRGGHDPAKVYAAYEAAVEHNGSPTVILAKTIKGYGLGEAGEGKNITHQQKQLNEKELREFRSRFAIPISDEDVGSAPFYRPAPDSEELAYLQERRRELGGSLPARIVSPPAMERWSGDLFSAFDAGSGEHPLATTKVFVRLLSRMLKDEKLGSLIVPIVPDEARTFGMEALFRQVGIYSHVGQRYDPVDRETLLYYKEATDGQILEEGITEAGSISSFIAAGTAYATHGIRTIPFFIFYSMFGFQRIGDLVWAAGDSRCRGFLIGGTAGRTTLAGEGLQHQDGHSHLLSFTNPRVVSYDPAFAYEIGVIIHRGLERMHLEDEDLIYYMTVYNEPYLQPPMPEGAREGILKGMYPFRPSGGGEGTREDQRSVHLLGSGPILNEVLKAQTVLEERYGVKAQVWSVTSYTELLREALAVDRWNRLHPLEPARLPYVSQCLGPGPSVVVCASDFSKALPCSLSSWIPGRLVSLGTDGFGRSETRQALRRFFEVDHRQIILGTLRALAEQGAVENSQVAQALAELEIDPDKTDPMTA